MATMTLANQGAQGLLACEADSIDNPSWDANSEVYEFLSESIRKTPVVHVGGGIRGTRARTEEQSRLGAYTVGGGLSMNLYPWALDEWLPRILGTAEAANAFALNETLVGFAMMIEKLGDCYEYTECYVNTCSIKGSAGAGLVTMDLTIVAKDENKGNDWSALSIPTTMGATGKDTDEGVYPYIFSEAVVVIGSHTVPCMDFEILIDNMLDARHTTGSTSVTSITPQDRSVIFRATCPFVDSDIIALYDATSAESTNTVTITGTGGVSNCSTIFTFGKLWSRTPTPVITGKTEVVMNLEFECLRDDTTPTPELAVTHDADQSA